MIYPNHFEEKTGFDKVRLFVASNCLSPLGKDRVDAMAFSNDFPTIHTWLSQTAEFVRILQGDEEFPANNFFDVR